MVVYLSGPSPGWYLELCENFPGLICTNFSTYIVAPLVFFCAVWEGILITYSVVTRDEPRQTLINTGTEANLERERDQNLDRDD